MTAITGLLIIVLCIYLLFRNDKVLVLQKRVTDGCYNYILYYLDQFKDDTEYFAHIEEYKEINSKMVEIIERYSYFRMLFDFRPLTLESWYEKDEVKLIEEYENYR